MMIGLADNSNVNVAFAIEAIILITADGAEHSVLHFGVPGVTTRVHLTPSEFMSKIGSALEQMQGRAALLGMMHGGKQ